MHARYRSTEWTTNADIPGPALRELFPLDAEVHKFMVSKLSQSISARGFDRILKLSWTLADLHQRERPDESDVVQAAALRDAQGTWAA
jgi:magnesium chelatase family protein